MRVGSWLSLKDPRPCQGVLVQAGGILGHVQGSKAVSRVFLAMSREFWAVSKGLDNFRDPGSCWGVMGCIRDLD